jgi:outer membrane protein assembly factor BamB
MATSSSAPPRASCIASGAGKGSDREISQRIVKPKISSEAAEIAADILKTSGIDAGYALVLGAGDGQLLAGLVEQSDLLVYCLEPDAKKAAAVQKMLDAAGLLGVRAAVHCGTSDTLPYNPYFANLVVWDSSSTILNAPELYRVLRPCGGVACLLGGDSAAMRTSLRSANVPAEEITKSSIGAIVRRGKLPETGEWTHPHANIGRTGCSEDAIARLPLGMLWWGGPGPARIVSRHWRAPVPLFANGVLYVQGQHDVFAIDAYNGREMWNRHIENVGRFPPTHRGGNIIADDNGVYCVQGTKCQYLDIQTGKTIREYEFHLTDAHRRAMNELLPDGTDPESKRIVWEYLGLSGDILLGTLGHEKVAKQEQEGLPDTDGIQQSRFLFAIDLKHIQQSRFLFAIDRNSGRLLWEKTLDRSVSPTAIVADSQSVYLLDRDGGAKYSAFRRKGVGTAVSELKAIDLATGRVSWTSKEMPPAWKSLMLRGDVLVAYPNPAEASSIDGDEGVGVFDSTSGKMLWSKEKLSHVSETGRGGTMRHTFIVGDTLFLPWAFDLRTGEEKLLEEHPITGRPERFHVPGKNFCGTFSAAKDLLIYRSASIGFAEINRDSGSYWLPESRPSCWISVIPAGGVVLAPEGYSTCICPYNFKTSLAMIPVERHENWSVYLAGGRRENRLNRKPEKREKYLASVSELSRNVHSLHVNINAPGDQMDSEGRLWLAWPRPFNPTQNYSIQPVPIQMEGRETGFRLNSDYHQISGTQAPWLYTSGLAGPLKFIVDLDGDEADYDVTLNFAEIEDAKRGERVFDVKVQGKIVLASLDVVVAADGTNRALMKIFRNIPAKDTLTVELIPVRGKPILCSLSVTREQTR